MQLNPLFILGLMSGTSLDGLDLALCRFYRGDDKTQFELIASETIPYDVIWKEHLQNAYNASAQHYFKLHSLYGQFIADQVNHFLLKHTQKPHYIASHGHTIFHRPELGFSTQIGCGATIAAKTGISTICDFRTKDTALGGQGAPLVPIGDRDLFHSYSACLNIGGIANISFTENKMVRAFDICVANMALNYLVEPKGKPFDDGGEIASKGTVNNLLLEQMLILHTKNKSLGREWFELNLLSILQSSALTIEDKLATCTEYIAKKIGDCLNEHNLPSVLISGGGAYNFFLINRIKTYYKGVIEIPSDEIIQFKEAIIFAYLGFLRVNEQINTLSSVTHAKENSISGCIYLAK